MMSHLAREAHALPQIASLLLLKPDAGWLRCGNALHLLQGLAQVLTLAMKRLSCLSLIISVLEMAFKYREDLFCGFCFQMLIGLKQMQTSRFSDLTIFFIY
jgi:hypothetical protein